MAFKICSIGCGNMASKGHGPSLRKYAQMNPDVILAACCDLDEQKALKFQREFGFSNYYSSLDTMLDTERPDAVSLVVPEILTAGIAIKVIKKGYPIIMEKPPGINTKEANQIIDAAQKSGVANQVSFNRRYIPLVKELKKLLDMNFKPSEIQNIRYDFFRVNRRDPDFSTTAIHAVDLVRFISGSDYENIRFRYQEFPDLGPNVANIFMDCTLESGATAQLSFCPVSGEVIEHITVNTFNNTFILNIPQSGTIDFPGNLTLAECNKVKLDISGKDMSDGSDMYEVSGFYSENASFFDDIRAGRKPIGDVKSAVQSIEVSDCIRERCLVYKKN